MNCRAGAAVGWSKGLGYLLMSEFKFACPICGQHITTDSGASGKPIECPTCFRKIVVPQAPASEDTRLILSASQAADLRPAPLGLGACDGLAGQRPLTQRLGQAATLLLLFAATAGATWLLWGKKLVEDTASAQFSTPQPPQLAYPIPADIKWSLNLTNAVFPEGVAAGNIHGCGFLCERATLQGGRLTLRQGRPGGAPVMGVSVHLFARQGEELSGKSIDIASNRAPPLPRVTVRWKEDQQPSKEEFLTGYALRLAFRQAAHGRIAGRIYLCLPDEARSFVAGTFDAEIRRTPPAKSK